jgi:hypothetical protein
LNKNTVRNSYPLPRIDDLLDKLQGAKYFSSLDLLAGYHQLGLRKEDIQKTAFKTSAGLFQFRVLCFGLTNAPSAFQAVMNTVFRAALNKHVLIYLDDIMIFSKTRAEHLRHIEEVFQILRKEGLAAKFVKCQFFKEELKFLGHIVTSDGVKPDPGKIEAVKNWPIPRTQTEVRGFLGLTNYFRKFIEGYSALAGPLIDLTRKELGPTVMWTAECSHAFTNLKAALVAAPVLVVPDFSQPFKVVTDASQVGLGGVLLQGDRPVAFESKKFNSAERNYSTTDRELLGVVHCLKKWKIYMLGNQDNMVVTDHKPNTTWDTKQDLSGRQVRWIEFLQQFNIKFKYEKGETNIADPLSRLSSFYLAVMTRNQRRGPDEDAAVAPSAAAETSTLPPPPARPPLLLNRILTSCKDNYGRDPYYGEAVGLTQVDGLYYKDDRICVPNVKHVRDGIMFDCHNTLFAGHMGKHKTTELVKRLFWWPGLDADVAQYVSTCHTCQTAKSSKCSSQGLLQPLSVPERPWWSVSLDFVTGLPRTKRGHDAILTVVDRLTRLTHVIPTTTTCDAEEFAYLFKKEVIAKHGCPGDIVSDRGSVFTGKFWGAVCEALQMHLSMSTSFHPQADGSTEIVNKLIEQVLRCHCLHDQEEWDENVCMVEFAINNSHHTSLKHTPFFLNYGMHPATPMLVDTLRLSKVPAAAKWTREMSHTLEQAKIYLQEAKDRQKSYADAKRKEIELKVGDQVLLSTTNLNPKFGTRKLYPRWIGPFPVTHKVNDVAYKIELPSSVKIHNVFHIGLLKPYKPSGNTQPPPAAVNVEGQMEWEVESILLHREVKSGSRMKTEYLVKWTGFGPEHCTWEPERNMTNCAAVVDLYWKQQALKETARSRTTAGKKLPEEAGTRVAGEPSEVGKKRKQRG